MVVQCPKQIYTSNSKHSHTAGWRSIVHEIDSSMVHFLAKTILFPNNVTAAEVKLFDVYIAEFAYTYFYSHFFDLGTHIYGVHAEERGGGGIIDLLFIFENGRGESQTWSEVRLSTVALKKKTPFSFYQRVQTTKVVHWKRVYSSALDLTVKKNGLSEGSYTLGVFKLTPFSFRISGKTTPMSL